MLSPKKLIFLVILCSGNALAATGAVAAKIVVMEFELHDLTLNPDTLTEQERVTTLRPLLVQYLTETHGIEVVDNPASAVTEAAKGVGYLFERPAVSARIGREVGVDWVVSGRLHKASFLFVYLKAQLINVATGAISADFVVEIKGPQKKLTHKGVETLAKQVNDALGELM